MCSCHTKMKITQYERILDLLCQSFPFKCQRFTTVITRPMWNSTKTIRRLKDEIVSLYPKAYTKKLVSGAVGTKQTSPFCDNTPRSPEEALKSSCTFATPRTKGASRYTHIRFRVKSDYIYPSFPKERVMKDILETH